MYSAAHKMTRNVVRLLFLLSMFSGVCALCGAVINHSQWHSPGENLCQGCANCFWQLHQGAMKHTMTNSLGKLVKITGHLQVRKTQGKTRGSTRSGICVWRKFYFGINWPKEKTTSVLDKNMQWCVWMSNLTDHGACWHLDCWCAKPLSLSSFAEGDWWSLFICTVEKREKARKYPPKNILDLIQVNGMGIQ